MRDFPLSFHPAAAADAARIQALSHAAYQNFVARIGRQPEPLTVSYADVLNSSTTWIAEDERGHLAGALVLKRAGDHLLIWSVAVAPELQGQGIGRRLLALAEREALRSGLPEIRLYTNEKMTENVALYERHGYAVTQRDVRADRVIIHMSKAIPGNAPDVVGVLLAGGQSQRMGGGDKCLRPLGGRP